MYSRHKLKDLSGTVLDEQVCTTFTPLGRFFVLL